MTRKSRKFIQGLAKPVYAKLGRMARKRGITLQQLIRAVILPEWLGQSRKKRKRRWEAKMMGRFHS